MQIAVIFRRGGRGKEGEKQKLQTLDNREHRRFRPNKINSTPYSIQRKFRLSHLSVSDFPTYFVFRHSRVASRNLYENHFRLVRSCYAPVRIKRDYYYYYYCILCVVIRNKRKKIRYEIIFGDYFFFLDYFFVGTRDDFDGHEDRAR